MRVIRVIKDIKDIRLTEFLGLLHHLSSPAKKERKECHTMLRACKSNLRQAGDLRGQQLRARDSLIRKAT